MVTLEYADGYGASIQTARRLTDAEKTHYSDEWKEKIFIGTSDEIKLDYIKWSDLPKRTPDGAFNGCSNRAWEISEDEKTALIALNDARAEAKTAHENAEEIKEIESAIAEADKQKDIPTKAEAERRMKAYNDLNNEGGEGFVPHIYSKEEYVFLNKRLSELKTRRREK